MALVDTGGDAWLIEYEACERLYGDIVKQLSERDAQPSKSDRFNTISASIRILLSQYNIQLSQLEDRMKASRNLTVEERERRLRLAENLASKFVHLTKLYKTNPEKQERRQLFGAPSWRDDDDSDVPLLGSDASVQDLKDQQKTILAEQDRGLENLSSIIGRQKHIAIAISGEVESQNEIIDDIGARMDATNDRIRGTSNTVRNVNAYSNDDATWCHWLIIIVLLFCIIGVASS